MSLSPSAQPNSRFTPAQRVALSRAYAILLQAAAREGAEPEEAQEKEDLKDRAASERLAAGDGEQNYVAGTT